MKLFLDDLRDPPPGVILCRTAAEAIRLIDSSAVTEISFDHDLGDGPTGYDVAKHIEEGVATGRIPMPCWQIHSATPVGRRNIEAAMQSAQRFANRPSPSIPGQNSMRQQILFKHSGSSAVDANTFVDIDHQHKVVRVVQTTISDKPFFSSTLLIGLAERLAQDGIDLIVGDEKSWEPQQAPWRLFVRFGDQTFDARFYRLILEKSVCVELWPVQSVTV